jgi:glycyl-tRNA synthetase beta chain
MLLSERVSQDLMEAVITVDFSFLNRLEERIAALKRFREVSKGFQPLAMAFKRIMNIVRGFEGTSMVNPKYFEDKSEGDLWKTFQAVKDRAKEEIDKGNYLDALNLMVSLSGPVDEFFSQVMVMAEDKRVRENRLGMLKGINEFFFEIADFSKFPI